MSSTSAYTEGRYKQELTIAIINGLVTRDNFYADDYSDENSPHIKSINKMVNAIIKSQG